MCVDLIPYNDIGTQGPETVAEGTVAEGGTSQAKGGEGRLVKAEFDTVASFQRVVREGGLACFVRVTRGDDDSAACGQLATTAAVTATRL